MNIKKNFVKLPINKSGIIFTLNGIFDDKRFLEGPHSFSRSFNFDTAQALLKKNNYITFQSSLSLLLCRTNRAVFNALFNITTNFKILFYKKFNSIISNRYFWHTINRALPDLHQHPIKCNKIESRNLLTTFILSNINNFKNGLNNLLVYTELCNTNNFINNNGLAIRPKARSENFFSAFKKPVAIQNEFKKYCIRRQLLRTKKFKDFFFNSCCFPDFNNEDLNYFPIFYKRGKVIKNIISNFGYLRVSKSIFAVARKWIVKNIFILPYSKNSVKDVVSTYLSKKLNDLFFSYYINMKSVNYSVSKYNKKFGKFANSIPKSVLNLWKMFLWFYKVRNYIIGKTKSVVLSRKNSKSCESIRNYASHNVNYSENSQVLAMFNLFYKFYAISRYPFFCKKEFEHNFKLTQGHLMPVVGSRYVKRVNENKYLLKFF